MTEKVILEKVNKQKISNDEMLQVSELVSTIQDQQDQVNEIEEKLKTKKEVLRRLKEEDLPNKFAEMNMSEVKMENGDKITIKPLYRGHISKTNQPSAYKWLREHNHGDLIKNEVKITFGKGEDANAAQVKEDLNNKGYSFTDREAVHPMSLSAFIREQTEKGKALPHDLLGVHVGQTTTIKRGE
jgi:hypothetical protein